MSLSVINSDVQIQGNLYAKGFTPPAGSITDSSINAAAGIQTTKMRHRYTKFAVQPNVTDTTETKGIHVVRGSTATVMEVVAGTIAACIGGATITVDVKKNGTSILNSVLTLNNANTARVAVAASLNVSDVACVVGDWLEVVITATTGGGTIGTGLFIQMMIDEDPS